jgi:hypothetical protein
VGIVINPTQQSFFSALRSGLGVESYSSAYWDARGRHRFYRYVKGAGIAGVKDGRGKARTQDLTPVTFEDRGSADAGSPAQANPVDIESPRVQVINSGRPKPIEVTQALLRTFKGTREGLGDADVLGLTPALIVFSKLEVKAVRIHGEQGQATVRITTPVSVARGKVDLKTRQQTQSWLLRRLSRAEWELLLPQDAIYLPQDDAVRVLSHQLALLTEPASTSTSGEKSQLAQMLKTLLTE